MKRAIICCFALVLLTSTAQAQTRFGGDVAVADGAAFAGASGGDRTSGAVYVYRGDSGAWVEQLRLVASDSANADGFGRALATAGETLLVGAPAQEEGRGAAYVFERTDDGWKEQARLTPPADTTIMGFGSALAFDGTTAVIGTVAQRNPWEGATPGAKNTVYVYRRDAETGQFGEPMTIDGNALGARTSEADASGEGETSEADTSGAGMAESDTSEADTSGTGSGEAEMAETSGAHASFGSAVAVSGDLVLVGAPGSMRDPDVQAAVYPFRWNEGAGTWDALPPIMADNAQGPSYGFGGSLAFDGELALVGAPMDGGTGAVFAYAQTEGDEAFQRVRTLRPFDGAEGGAFGTAFAVTPGTVWVGAPGGYRSDQAGRVYVYRRDAETGDFAEASSMTAPEGAPGDNFGTAIAASENVAVVGSPGDDYGAGTAILMMPGPDGRWAPQSTVYNNAGALQAVVGEEIGCQSGAAAGFDCEGMELQAFLPIDAIGGGRGVRLNDIWGWTDSESGKEYALVGRMDGAAFVDVSDPTSPVYVGSLPKTEGSPGSAWRDIKVYEDHAFVVSDAADHHGMQVFDLTRLRDFDGTPETYEPDAWYGNVHSVHNIVINEETGFAYAVGSSSGGETCGGGLHMINIQDPLNPEFAGCFADASTGRRGTGYTHDAQCVVYSGPDEDYQGQEICFGSNETALSIADVTDKENPVAIAAPSYPNVAYSHQAWLTEDQRYLYMNDELDEFGDEITGTRTLIWDVEDLDDPQLVREFVQAQPSSDHNLYIKGDLMYQSNYASGLRIFDISDPENPAEAGYFDTNPFGDNGPGFSGSWSNYPYFESGTVVVSSIGEGLFVLRKSETPKKEL